MILTQYLATFPNLSRPLARRRAASSRHSCCFLCRHKGSRPLATLLQPCCDLLWDLPTFYDLFCDILQPFNGISCKSCLNKRSHDLSRPFPTFSQPFYNLLQHFTTFTTFSIMSYNLSYRLYTNIKSYNLLQPLYNLFTTPYNLLQLFTTFYNLIGNTLQCFHNL